MNERSERWSELYRRAFPRVYRALAATLFDHDAALDALHDAFVEGLQRPPAHDRNLEGWLYRVALRRARRTLVRASAQSVRLDPSAADTTDGIERSLARLEVGRLLQLLSERQRTIVLAHFYLGMQHHEVAELLGIRAGTVGATISQALERMRKGAPDAI